MNRFLLCLPLVLSACASAGDDSLAVVSNEPVNQTCPRSGKPVAEDSLTEYRGYVVGFCNTHCRDDFAAHRDERPEDRAFFDSAIAERTSAGE